MNDFGSRLRAERTAQGLTQLELAHGIMSTSQLSLLEQGKRRPSTEALTSLAERLDVPVAWLCPSFTVVGRARSQCRMEQARWALQRCHYATAERLATQVIFSPTNAERRMHGYVLRAEAREAMRLPGAALADLDVALDIARHRGDSRALADIAFFRERLRHQLLSDDAA